MKKTTSVSLFIATFVATGLTATFATAAPDIKWHVKDNTASGSAFSYDGCENVSVDVGGSETRSQDGGGPPVKDNTAWAGYSSYNWCTGAQTYGWVYLPGGFDGDLQGATIDAEFEAESFEWIEVEGQWVYNYIGTVTVEINAELTGVGQTTHGTNSSTSHWGSSHTHSRYVGKWREATLDISVTVDGQSIELTDGLANLGSANSGTVAVYE